MEQLRREDALMAANNNVTEALRRTTALMQAELERSVLSQQMLGNYVFLDTRIPVY